MSYQVWTKDEFEGWKRKDCTDLAAAQGEIMVALKRGAEPLLTMEVPFSVSIEIKEVKTGEVNTGTAKPGEGPGVEGEGEVRRGDTPAVSELNS